MSFTVEYADGPGPLARKTFPSQQEAQWFADSANGSVYAGAVKIGFRHDTARYELRVIPMTNGDIHQTVDLVESDGIRERIFDTIMRTREEQTRAALIALGWTPPPERTP